MTSILWLETECEHGNIDCYQDAKPSHLCPEGSRRRVTIDYEAAAEAVVLHPVREALRIGGYDTNEILDLEVKLARVAVDAALVVDDV